MARSPDRLPRYGRAHFFARRGSGFRRLVAWSFMEQRLRDQKPRLLKTVNL
jgi:hypothetical protein